jgi:hypothetical protein
MATEIVSAQLITDSCPPNRRIEPKRRKTTTLLFMILLCGMKGSVFRPCSVISAYDFRRFKQEAITAAKGGGFGNVAPGRCALAGSSREIILRNPFTPLMFPFRIIFFRRLPRLPRLF